MISCARGAPSGFYTVASGRIGCGGGGGGRDWRTGSWGTLLVENLGIDELVQKFFDINVSQWFFNSFFYYFRPCFDVFAWYPIKYDTGVLPTKAVVFFRN